MLFIAFLNILGIGLRVVSHNQEEDKKDDESSVVQHRIYCVECGIGIATQEEFLNHLFTCRANAYQNNIKDQLIAKATLQQALDYTIEEKRVWFKEKMNKLRISFYEDTLTLVLSRDNVLDETMNQFSTVDNLNLHKDIKIFFIDEEARDAGGVIREWLSIMTQELLKPESKNFELIKNGEDSFYTIHPEASFEMMHFTGQIFGKAVFEGVPIDWRLSRLLLMKLSGLDTNFEDLKYYDETLYSSLAYLNNEDVNVDDLCMDFTIMDNGRNVELKPNGNETPLTNENKSEYNKKVVEYYTSERAANQTFAFINSFLAIIPNESLSVFTIDELEKILFGQRDISIDDWKANTFYKGKYSDNPNHNVIQWFWEILSSLPNEDKRKFLQFWTGSKSLPIEGFKGLKGMKKQPWKFSIESISMSKSQFLRAHTCFNSLELPMFDCKKDVQGAVQYVLDQTEFHFGLE